MPSGRFFRLDGTMNLDLPSGPPVAAIGSDSFWGNDSINICTAVGDQLANIERLSSELSTEY